MIDLRKYAVIIRTEEMKGRLDSTRTVKCASYEQAQKVFEREYDAIARNHDLFVDEDIDDDVRVVEYFCKMRSTLTIVKA